MADFLSIPLPTEVISQLTERANAEGIDILTLAGRALCREANRPSLESITKPVQEAFLASGISEDELAELLEVEKHAMRTESK
jgi:hypothetical protein